MSKFFYAKIIEKIVFLKNILNSIIILLLKLG